MQNETEENIAAEPVSAPVEIDYKNKYLEALAQMRNNSNQLQNEISDVRKFATTKLLTDLIPLLDSFDMALQYNADENTKQGLIMIKTQFLQTLLKHGVKALTPEIGTAFDPHTQEAFGYSEIDNDQAEPGSIANVVQAGYTLHDRLIRPARVMLVKEVNNASEDKE